jgi:hypothetical protein
MAVALENAVMAMSKTNVPLIANINILFDQHAQIPPKNGRIFLRWPTCPIMPKNVVDISLGAAGDGGVYMYGGDD